MAIPSRQIGWSTKSNLLWEISKQLEALTGVIGRNIPVTTTSTTSSTSTTTTTTTAPPASTLILSTIDGSSACTQSGPFVTLTSITYNTGTGLCDSVALTSPNVIPTSGGNFWVSDGTNYRPYYKVPGAGVDLITFTGPCVSCL